MATIKRALLKQIVKECLVEIIRDENIITEGLKKIFREGVQNASQPKSTLREAVLPRARQQQQQQKPSGVNPNFEKSVQTFSKVLSHDPIFQDIIADTAMTTLQEQNSSGHIAPSSAGLRGNGLAVPDQAQQIAAQNSPVDLFVGADRWEKLAFFDKKSK